MAEVLKAGTVILHHSRDEELQKALAEAYEEGRRFAEEGAAGRQAAAAERGAAALEKLLHVAEQSRSAALDLGTRTVATAALDIVEWVLRQDASQRTTGLIARLTETATNLLPAGKWTVVSAPAEAEYIRAWALDRPDVTVVESVAIAPGDAQVQYGDATADVSVSAALRIAAEVLGVESPAA